MKPYESFLESSIGIPATRLSEDEAEVFAENILGPRQGQDLFAMVAALVARRRVASLEAMYRGATRLHVAIGDRTGTAKDDDLADIFGAPFRHGEPAVLHAVRALAGLGLTMASDAPDPRWLQASLAWHRAARSAPEADPVPWAPGALAGDDAHLRERLELLAEAASPQREAAYVLSAAMTLCRLAKPLVEPTTAMLLSDPFPALRTPISAPSDHTIRAQAIRNALLARQLVRRGSWSRSRRSPLPGNGITVLFDQGQVGMQARLSMRTEKGLPSCLIPDPERMSLFAADNGFQRAMACAWQQAGRDKIHGMVLWSMETAEGPQRYAMGESLGAAFAVVLDEARRLQRPLATLLAIRRLIGDNAVTGRIDDLGYMQSVEGYDTKLKAFSNAGKVIVPQTDHQRAELAVTSMTVKPELVPVGRWKQAASKARGSTRSVLVRDTAIAFIIVGLAVVTAVISRADQQLASTRASAAASELITSSKALASSDPVLARLTAVASWRLAPSDRTRQAMRNAAALQPVAVFNDPTDGIQSIAFSPDGKLLAVAAGSEVGGSPAQVQLWNMRTHQKAGHSLTLNRSSAGNGVGSMAFSPNGKILAVGTEGGTVPLWNVTSRRKIGVIATGPFSPGSSVSSIEFSPNGKTMAIASASGAVQFWNVADRRMLDPPIRATKYSEAPSAMAFDADGQTLEVFTPQSERTADPPGRLRLWDVATHREIGMPFTLTGSDSPLIGGAAAFSPDGKILAIGGYRPQLRNVASPKRIAALPGSSGYLSQVGMMAFSPDGKVLATYNSNRTIRIWDVATRQVIAVVPATPSPLNSMAFSPDDRILATGSADGMTRLWDAAITNPFVTGAVIGSIAFSMATRTLAARVPDHPGWIQLWNIAKRRRIGVLQSADASRVGNAQFSQDGKILAVSHNDGTVQLWDVANDRPIGRRLPYPSLNPGYLPDSPEVAFSPDGRTLLTTYLLGKAQLWDAATTSFTGKFGVNASITAAAFSPSGKLAVTGTSEGVQLWNAVSQRRAGTPLGSPGTPDALVFSANSKTLIAGYDDGEVRLWDIADRQHASTTLAPAGYRSQVDALALSPDGTVLAVGGDGTVQLWDIPTRQPIGEPLTIPGRARPVRALAFSPGSMTLFIGTDAGTQLLHVGYIVNPVQSLCRMAGRPLTSTEWMRYVPGWPYQKICP